MNISLVHYQISYQIHHTDHTLGLLFADALRPLGITAAQVGVLLHLDRFPGVAMPHLVTAVAVTPQTMHRIIISLEKHDWIERRRRADNKKTYYISLTSTGKIMLQRAEAVLKSSQDELKQHFTSKELKTLHDLLQRFEATIKGNMK